MALTHSRRSYVNISFGRYCIRYHKELRFLHDYAIFTLRFRLAVYLRASASSKVAKAVFRRSFTTNFQFSELYKLG